MNVNKRIKNKEPGNLTGCCGLYCGLCSKYQSKSPSRCIGCKPGDQHLWCSIWNCCVKKHGFETCAECNEIDNCEILVRRKVAEWIPAIDNLRQIKKEGLAKWLNGQKERQSLLEELLQNFNEGRSMSFLCKACARMPVNLIYDAMQETNKKIADEKITGYDKKARAAILKSSVKDKAGRYSINLS